MLKTILTQQEKQDEAPAAPAPETKESKPSPYNVPAMAAFLADPKNAFLADFVQLVMSGAYNAANTPANPTQRIARILGALKDGESLNTLVVRWAAKNYDNNWLRELLDIDAAVSGVNMAFGPQVAADFKGMIFSEAFKHVPGLAAKMRTYVQTVGDMTTSERESAMSDMAWRQKAARIVLENDKFATLTLLMSSLPTENLKALAAVLRQLSEMPSLTNKCKMAHFFEVGNPEANKAVALGEPTYKAMRALIDATPEMVDVVGKTLAAPDHVQGATIAINRKVLEENMEVESMNYINRFLALDAAKRRVMRDMMDSQTGETQSFLASWFALDADQVAATRRLVANAASNKLDGSLVDFAAMNSVTRRVLTNPGAPSKSQVESIGSNRLFVVANSIDERSLLYQLNMNFVDIDSVARRRRFVELANQWRMNPDFADALVVSGKGDAVAETECLVTQFKSFPAARRAATLQLVALGERIEVLSALALQFDELNATQHDAMGRLLAECLDPQQATVDDTVLGKFAVASRSQRAELFAPKSAGRGAMNYIALSDSDASNVCGAYRNDNGWIMINAKYNHDDKMLFDAFCTSKGWVATLPVLLDGMDAYAFIPGTAIETWELLTYLRLIVCAYFDVVPMAMAALNDSIRISSDEFAALESMIRSLFAADAIYTSEVAAQWERIFGVQEGRAVSSHVKAIVMKWFETRAAPMAKKGNNLKLSDCMRSRVLEK